jgi:DNA processing protein
VEGRLGDGRSVDRELTANDRVPDDHVSNDGVRSGVRTAHGDLNGRALREATVLIDHAGPASRQKPLADQPELAAVERHRRVGRNDRNRIAALQIDFAGRARLRVVGEHAVGKLASSRGSSCAVDVVTNEDLADRLRLLRTPGIGPVTYRQLIVRFGTPAAALAAVPDLARRGGGKAPALRSREEAQREIAKVEKVGARFLVLGQGLYPTLLGELEDAPPLLIAKGDLGLLDRQAVAIVGARNASAAACRFARGLAHDLGQDGLVVVSGLARGIDSAAHDGALESGTIGVIAGGIDIFYPPESRARQEALYERGLVLAEMPPGTEPRARHFPYRNRIIAGMSSGTVVVEAAPRSGSLITARLAAEAGRDVMAVPGSPLDPRAQGCNQLIRDGATLVQNAADVVEAIGPYESHVRSAAEPYRHAPEQMVDGEDVLASVEALLGPSPVPVDEIIRLSGASSGSVQMALLELDLGGRLDRHAGNKVSLRAA